MAHMPLDYFSNARSRDAKNKHDIKGGTWLQTMYSHIFKNRSKQLTKSFRTKRFRKSLYTIIKTPLKTKDGEWAKAKINAYRSKVTSILGWKSLTEGGRSTSISEWKRQRTPMVWSNGAIGVFRASAHTIQAYSLTWARPHAWHDRVNGSGVGSGVKKNNYIPGIKLAFPTTSIWHLWLVRMPH